VFGVLTYVGTNSWFSLTSPNAGFGVGLAWEWTSKITLGRFDLPAVEQTE